MDSSLNWCLIPIVQISPSWIYIFHGSLPPLCTYKINCTCYVTFLLTSRIYVPYFIRIGTVIFKAIGKTMFKIWGLWSPIKGLQILWRISNFGNISWLLSHTFGSNFINIINIKIFMGVSGPPRRPLTKSKSNIFIAHTAHLYI